MTQDSAIYCDLTVFSPDSREQVIKNVPDMLTMFQAVEYAKPLPNGYAFQFPNEAGMFLSIANFIEHERQCCAFYHFALEVEPNSGPIWLRMTGGEGVREFMETAWQDIQGAVKNNLMKTGATKAFDEAIDQAAEVLPTIFNKTAVNNSQK